MAFSRRHLATWLLLCCGPLPFTLAQAESANQREVSFTVFSASPLGQLGYVAKPGTPLVRIVLYPTARSSQYRYRGPPTVQLLDLQTGLVVAEFGVPPGLRRALVILWEDPTAPPTSSRCKMNVYDDSLQPDGTGTRRILNLSGLELAGTINGRQVTLRAGSNALGPGNETAVITLRTPFNGRTYQAYAETLPPDPSGRNLLLLLPPYRRGSLEVQSRYLMDAAAPATDLKGS